MPDRTYLTVAEVLAIQHQQIEEYGGVHGVRDNGLLESAIFRPQVGYYAHISEEAAALMESLATNHPFFDGNKRVAFAAAHTFLLVNGYDLEIVPLAAYEFMMSSISKGEFHFAQILGWIKSHMVSLINPAVAEKPPALRERGARAKTNKARKTLKRAGKEPSTEGD